ncbi:hypothetical protein ABPG75_011026 [Micractinium tetrahymenae]
MSPQSRPASGAPRPRSGAPGSKPGTAGAGAARKGSAAPAALPAGAAAAADELRAKADLMERGLKNEELARNYMQLERDKIQGFWDITKRDLTDAKTELRLKDRELEEAEDKHALELKVYKQRVKHLLYEHQDGLSRLKAAGEAALKQQADVFAQQEAQLGDDKRRLKQHVREQELSAEELIKQFRLDNAKQASRMRQDFEGQARAIQAKYEAQLKALQQAAEAHYATDLAELEEAKNAHIADLMARHEAAFRDMRAYYNQVTHSNLDLIKALKEEIADMKAAEAAREKLVGDVVRENRRLAEPLAQAVQEADVLRQQVEGAERDRTLLAATKARLAAAEKQARATEWELEVTQQRLEKVQQERDELQHRFDAGVLQAQQRSALRAAVLERRLQATSQELAALTLQNTAVGPAVVGDATGVEAGKKSLGCRAGSAAPRASAQASQLGSRRGSKQEAAGAGGSGSDWVKAMLEAALHTPLPDQDAELLEDEGPCEVLEQIAELAEAADVAEAPAVPAGKADGAGASALAALEAKLSQAALGAQEAAALAGAVS